MLFNVLPGKIGDAYATARTTPAFQQALAANPSQGQVLQQQTAGGGNLSDTSFLKNLAPAISHPFKVGFSSGITVVFMLALAVMIIGLIVVFFLPEIPLSRRSAQQQRADDILAAENSDGVPGEVGAGPLPSEPASHGGRHAAADPETVPASAGNDGPRL